MAAFNVVVQPGDLEQEVEQLQLLQTCEFSHLSMAESLWNDEFGAPDGEPNGVLHETAMG